jgi:hypothetical protein
MRLRQVALVARKLEPVVEDIRAVLGIEVSYNDPGVRVFGLTFLEVVSPVEANTTAGRLLDRRGGDGGYMVILQVDDLARERDRIERLGVRIPWETHLDDAATIHLHPKDVGGAILSLDWMSPPESWKWAGPGWQEKVRRDTSLEIAGAELQADDPRAMSDRWAEVLDRPARPRGEAWSIPLDRGEIRFIRADDRRGAGVSGLDVKATDRSRIVAAARARRLEVGEDTFRLCGTTFHLR